MTNKNVIKTTYQGCVRLDVNRNIISKYSLTFKLVSKDDVRDRDKKCIFSILI